MAVKEIIKGRKDRLKKLMERGIPARHVSELRNRCGIAEGEGVGGEADLPEEVIESYWAYKVLRDRSGDGSEFSPVEFNLIALRADQHQNIKDSDLKQAGVIELFRSKKLKKDDSIEFKPPRSRNFVRGKIRGLTDNQTKALCIADGDSQQHVVGSDAVRLIQEDRPLEQGDDEDLEDV